MKKIKSIIIYASILLSNNVLSNEINLESELKENNEIILDVTNISEYSSLYYKNHNYDLINDIRTLVPLNYKIENKIENYEIIVEKESEIKKNFNIGAVLNQGLNYLGVKYKFGGINEFTGFDCSGYVKKVFEKSIGLNLPRTSIEMSKLGEKIKSLTSLKPGDLVFFNIKPNIISHVGIYIGENKFIHAKGTGYTVTINELNDEYWKKRFNSARRVLIE